MRSSPLLHRLVLVCTNPSLCVPFVVLFSPFSLLCPCCLYDIDCKNNNKKKEKKNNDSVFFVQL